MKVIKNLTELKVERLPIVWTKSKNGPRYWNPENGKRSLVKEDVLEEGKEYQYIEKKTKYLQGVSIQYDESLDMICMIYCELNCSAEAMATTKKQGWEPFLRIYITRDKKIYSNDWCYNWVNNCCKKICKNPNYFYEKDWNNNTILDATNFKKCAIINSPCFLEDKDGNKTWHQYDCVAPFREFFGEIVPYNSNRMIALDSLDSVGIYLKIKQPTNTKITKNTKKLEELLEYELNDDFEIPEFETFDRMYDWRSKQYNASNGNVHKFAIIQKVEKANEPTCVLRSFFKSMYSDTVVEGGRIYFTKKEVISSRRLENGELMYQKLSDKPDCWNVSIEDFSFKETEGTFLEYFGSIVRDIPKEQRGVAIWSFLRYPITEKMFKIDEFKPYMEKMLPKLIIETPGDIIKDSFGKYDKTEKNPYKAIGINKYQLEKFMPLILTYFTFCSISPWQKFDTPIKTFKTIIGENDISSIDNKTTDWFFELIKDIFKGNPKTGEIVFADNYDYFYKKWNWNKSSRFSYLINAFYLTKEIYGLETMKAMKDRLLSLKSKEVTVKVWNDYYHSYMDRREEPIRVYRDYINMVGQLGAATRMKPYFDSMEHLISMHDMAQEIINSKKYEIEKNKWMNRKKEWEKYVFSDEKFSIIYPEEPEDLANEGITLCHCVKSYIPKVTNGDTNILFLRRNEDIDKPFFTIELDNQKIVQQVHGLQNCNASNEIKPFLKKWISSKKLLAENINKVR